MTSVQQIMVAKATMAGTLAMAPSNNSRASCTTARLTLGNYNEIDLVLSSQPGHLAQMAALQDCEQRKLYPEVER